VSHTYRITTLLGTLSNSKNPPEFLSVLFPGVAPSVVDLSEAECLVTFDTPQTPADLGPLVRVELLPSE
jgi:hypothetical protein